MVVNLSPRHELFKIDGGRKIMGLASGKAKLKLIDIESRSERNFTRPRGKLSPTSAPLNSQCQNRLASDDAETSATDGATEIGLTLHEARERSGQSLQDASHDLRIRLEYLRAIENEIKRLKGLPDVEQGSSLGRSRKLFELIHKVLDGRIPNINELLRDWDTANTLESLAKTFSTGWLRSTAFVIEPDENSKLVNTQQPKL